MIKDVQEHNKDVAPNSLGMEQLKQALPQYFDADGHFQLEKFQNMLKEDEVELSRESYELNFLGKSFARLLASRETETVLVPNEEHNASERNANSENVYITGDNLDALKHLAKSYRGKVKCIYIDPPYNTGSDDFAYNDTFNFTTDDLVEQIGVTELEAERILDLHGRASHSAWLTFMLPRLVLGRNLLTQDGVIFVSIDENEVENLTLLMNEIFGEQNFVECITWNKRVPKNDKGIGNIHEYVLAFARDISFMGELTAQKNGIDKVFELVESIQKRGLTPTQGEVEIRKFYKNNNFDRGITLYNNMGDDLRPWGKINMSWPNSNTFGPTYAVLHPITKRPVKVPDRGWRWKEETFQEAAGLVGGEYQSIIPLHDGSFMCGRVWFAKDENTQPSSVSYLDEADRFLLRSVISLKSDGGMETEALFGGKSIASYPKPTSLLRLLLDSIADAKDGIFLDFFSGSATTAHALMQLNSIDNGNRKAISVQIEEPVPEKSEAYKNGFRTIDEIGRKRIELAADKIKQDTGAEIDYGFKHFTLETPPQPIIDTLEEFNPNENLFSDDPLEPLNFEGTTAKNVLLTTWAVQDGYGLNPEFETVTLDTYELTVVGRTAYVIDGGFTAKDMTVLTRLIEDKELDINHLVYFNTALTFEVVRELQSALSPSQLRAGHVTITARW